MPISLEDNGRVERRLIATTATIAPHKPASRRLTAAPLASSFDVLQDAIEQLRLLAATMRYLRFQVRLSIVACESGTLPTDLLSGVALVKLEQDVLKLERQLDALVQRHYHRLRCVQQGRHWLSDAVISQGSTR